MKRSLVVGADGTGDSTNALARAAELAQAAGLRLVVVHVRHVPVLAEMSAMTIGAATADLDVIEAASRRASADVLQGTGVDWEFVVRSGDPAHELMAVAEAVSRRHRGGWPAAPGGPERPGRVGRRGPRPPVPRLGPRGPRRCLTVVPGDRDRAVGIT